MAAPVSLARRLALPLGLSLLLHAILVGIACLLPASLPSGEPARGTTSLALALGIDGPRRKPRPPAPSPQAFQSELVFPTSLVDNPPATTPGSGHASAAAGPSHGIDSGTGTARPTGSGLLAVPGSARRIVYLVDRSMSMGPGDALDVARREVEASLRQLPPLASFQIVAYNRGAEKLLPGDLVPAGPDHIEQAIRRMAALDAGGGTDHVNALCEALKLGPDLLFWLTDGADLTLANVQAVSRRNFSRAAIHVVELTNSAADGPAGPLALLAARTGGSHRRARPGP
jgi:hypothetical protein